MPGPVPVQNAVPTSDSQFIVAEARPTRRSIIIFNDSSEYLYLSYQTGVSSTFFTIKVPPNWYGTMPWGGIYAGTIYGVLAANDPGTFIMVTELIH